MGPGAGEGGATSYFRIGTEVSRLGGWRSALFMPPLSFFLLFPFLWSFHLQKYISLLLSPARLRFIPLFNLSIYGPGGDNHRPSTLNIACPISRIGFNGSYVIPLISHQFGPLNYHIRDPLVRYIMVTTIGSGRKTTETWLNNLSLDARRTPNRFSPLADMTTHDDFPEEVSLTAHPKKRKTPHRRKRYSRTVKRLVDREDMDLAMSGTPLPSDPMPAREAWEELPETYIPELGVTLNEVVTLDSLPRESPPMTIRVEKRRRRKEQVDMGDWDVVSTCSEESFCMV